MCAAGARVIGIDPTIVYSMQYLAVAKYLSHARPELGHALLPTRLEDVSPQQAFDTVLSMGVLYHRRDPAEHLHALSAHLRKGGELVLETLIVADGSTEVLIPNGRYARMRNVTHIPSRTTLKGRISRGRLRIHSRRRRHSNHRGRTAHYGVDAVRIARRCAGPTRHAAHDRRSPGTGALRGDRAEVIRTVCL